MGQGEGAQGSRIFEGRDAAGKGGVIKRIAQYRAKRGERAGQQGGGRLAPRDKRQHEDREEQTDEAQPIERRRVAKLDDAGLAGVVFHEGQDRRDTGEQHGDLAGFRISPRQEKRRDGNQ